MLSPAQSSQWEISSRLTLRVSLAIEASTGMVLMSAEPMKVRPEIFF